MLNFNGFYSQSEAVRITVTKLGALGDSDDLLDKFDVGISWISGFLLVVKCFVVWPADATFMKKH